MFRTWVIVGLAIILSACTGSVVPSQAGQYEQHGLSLKQRADSLKSEQACVAQQGEWRKVGKRQRFACILPASDAGKACTDSSQCEVACVSPSLSAQPAGEVTGQCQATTHRFGCRAFVENGKVGPALCID